MLVLAKKTKLKTILSMVSNFSYSNSFASFMLIA